MRAFKIAAVIALVLLIVVPSHRMMKSAERSLQITLVEYGFTCSDVGKSREECVRHAVAILDRN